VATGDVDSVRTLIETAGGDINTKDDEGSDALILACVHRQAHMVELLMACGISVDTSVSAYDWLINENNWP
jgi:ankyrin repeat protein